MADSAWTATAAIVSTSGPTGAALAPPGHMHHRTQEKHMTTHSAPPFVATTTFRVEGMTCDHCRNAVTAEVSAVPGVRTVGVDIEAGTVTVSADQPVDRSDIAAAVDEAGYTLLP
jgi:copper ion binding protein